jgi:8-oxo-dGTP pyrophosphatase MutT (NUDIX family)
VVYRRLKPKIETSHAILRLADKYILQLRDDKPGIAARGLWSLFGGRIGVGEKPMEAIKRELFEELTIRIEDFELLWYMEYDDDFVKGAVRTWFFVSDVEKIWNTHLLKEGKDVGIFSFQELERLDIPDIIRQALTRFHLKRRGSDVCRS